MNCNYCQNQYNQTTHVPRLLIFCGHSLCENCCITIHTNNRVQCPQCLSNTFIEDINFLPKNLALLKVQQPTQDSSTFCLKHDKKIQAFCEKQKMLLCVDCILQDGHRNHPVDSIKNCYGKEQSKFENMVKKLEGAREIISERYMLNKQNQQTSFQNYSSALKNIKGFYQQLRQIVEKEQEQAINKISEQHQSGESKFQQKNQTYCKKLQDINDCLETLSTSTHNNEFTFLASVSTRQELFTSIQTDVEEHAKALTYSSSKNIVGDNVIKNIQKNFKVSVNSLPSANNKKYEVNSLNNLKPIMRNKTSSQNQKTFSKKPVKKQSQNQISSSINTNKSGVYDRQKQVKNKEQKNKPLAKYDMNGKCDVSVVQAKQSLFNSFMSNMTSFLTDKKFLYVIGGFSDETNDIIRLNLNNYSWEKVASLHSNRSKFGTISIDKSVFLFGGKKGKQRVSDCQVWNGVAGEWQSGFRMKKCRSGFGSICIDQVVYIIGGNDGESILSSVETFNFRTGEWKKKQSMIQARDQLAVCLGKDNKIYAIGGFGTSNQQPLKTVQIYDLKTQKWYPAPSLKIPRRALAAASLADGIYAIGGFDGRHHLASVEKYEEGSKEWIAVADLKKGRCTHSAISVFDSQEIIVSGGFDEVPLDSLERYNLISNEWQIIAKMPSTRFMHGSVLITQ